MENKEKCKIVQDLLPNYIDKLTSEETNSFVEKHLEECLNSILNQTLKDIEIIIINDCSTDNTKNIIDKYLLKYPNIKVINNDPKISPTKNIINVNVIKTFSFFIASFKYCIIFFILYLLDKIY